MRSTRSVYPQWEVPRVGTPAPEVQATGVHRTQARRPSGAPTQAAEAMPSRSSSRGDARAAERARTGGAKTAP
jgi:hypothetical protein